MRSGTWRHVMGFYAVVAVLMSLAMAAYAQTRIRTAPRVRTRPDWQQGQMTPMQAGQPDFVRRMQERQARQMQEMQQDMEEMRRWAEESKNRSIQQAIRASDEQWRRLKPKLDRIERLKAETNVAVGPGSSGSSANGNFQTFTFGNGSGGGFGSVSGSGSGMGGFGSGSAPGTGSIDILDSNAPANTQSNSGSGSWTSGSKSRMEMTEGEILCDELQHLLQGQSASPEEVSQKVAALRRVRAQAREDLARARTELRTLIAPQQEPALIVMGYLD